MWPLITSESVLSSLSPDGFVDYQRWISRNPDKTGRLNEIALLVVAEFRAALASNPESELDPAEGSLPASCRRHATNIIIFQLKYEMGNALSESENASNIRADIFLRGVWIGSIPAAKAIHDQTPTYST